MNTFMALRLTISALAKVGTMVGAYSSCHFRPSELTILKKSLCMIKEQVSFIERRLSELETEKEKKGENGAYILDQSMKANEDLTWLSKLPADKTTDKIEPLFLHWSEKLSTAKWWA